MPGYRCHLCGDQRSTEPGDELKAWTRHYRYEHLTIDPCNAPRRYGEQRDSGHAAASGRSITGRPADPSSRPSSPITHSANAATPHTPPTYTRSKPAQEAEASTTPPTLPFSADPATTG